MAVTVGNPIPKGPPDLCFDSNSFTKELFSVDQFLQDHSNKANLETMRDDLGVYLKVLRSAMIELINKDYADFVNLSSNLIGLDKAINSIQTPLGQLREELLLVRQSIDDAMSDVSNQMGRRQELRERKRSLRSLMRAQTALKKLRILLSTGEDGCGGQCHLDSTVATLERAVAEYNQLQYNISKCQQYLSSKDHGIFISTGENLLKSISHLFLESISLGEKGKSGLTSSLAFYLMLGKLEEAERLYRQVVASAMNPIINEETLRSLPRGLPALYDKILLFADKDMKVLREITKDSERFPGIGNFNFFVRSFWPEVGNNLEVNLMSIYAAGDPDTFYQRYCETLRFVEELGKRCNNCDALNELNEHPNFISFMDKWNLPVYFQIRFQEIVKSLEVSFSNSEWESKSGSWKLVATETAWTSLMRCWESGVFLTPIAHKFWKLSLQIISRYCSWIGQVLNKKPICSKIETTLDFLVSLYSDIETYVKRLAEFETKALSVLPNITEKTSQLLHQSLDESKVSLQSRLQGVNTALIQCLIGESNSVLRQVSDIPRLFRRTNRDTPNKPCGYVTSLLEAVQVFYKKHHDHPQTPLWLQFFFSDITKQYYSSVAEVLTSVQKTEESLRRLKKARDRSTSQATVSPNDRRPGDDDKIRLQLLIDVQAFFKGVEQMGVKTSSIEKLSELLMLVETTQRS